MNNKIVKKYVYTGFDFPIDLHDVEMVKIAGEFHPKIDVKKLANVAIKAMVTQDNRLTGNQIKFIRSYFSMSLREFAKVVNESHAAVKKWENFLDDQANMDPNIEIMLRLYVYDQIVVKNEKKKIEFYNRYVELTKLFSDFSGKSKKLTQLSKHYL